MQISLPAWIDEFSVALSDPQGITSPQGAYLTLEEDTKFRACAVLIGLSEELLQYHDGFVSIAPEHAEYARLQLKEAQRAMKTLPEEAFDPSPAMVNEFAAGTLALNGEAKEYPDLDRLLRGLHMAATRKNNNGLYESFATTLSTRGEALDAIQLIRPDIAQTVRARAEKEGVDMDIAGILPATPKQIRDLQKSYADVVAAFSQKDAAAAQQELEKIRGESQPRSSVEKVIRQPGVITRSLPGGGHAVVISTRPREESTEHFMVDLDSMQSVLDLCRFLKEMRAHPDGVAAKYFPTKGEDIKGEKGEFWLHCDDVAQAEHRRNMFRTLLQDGKSIRIEKDSSKNRKHPDTWLIIPNSLMTRIQDEATWLHDMRDDVRSTFDQGDKDGAKKLKDELIVYAAPRIYQGQHAKQAADARIDDVASGGLPRGR